MTVLQTMKRRNQSKSDEMRGEMENEKHKRWVKEEGSTLESSEVKTKEAIREKETNNLLFLN